MVGGRSYIWSQVATLPKYQRMKNKFIGGKCQVRSCEKDFGGLTRHNYRPAPSWGLGCGIFMLVALKVSPQQRGTTLFDQSRSGCVMHPFFHCWHSVGMNVRTKSAKGQPLPTHSLCTQALKWVNLQNSEPSVCVDDLCYGGQTLSTCKLVVNMTLRSSAKTQRVAAYIAAEPRFSSDFTHIYSPVHSLNSSTNLSSYSYPDDNLINCLW